MNEYNSEPAAVTPPDTEVLPDALVAARNVHKCYQMGRRRVEVLQGINIHVERGGFAALRGASGAGKSTLLHLLAGLDTPDSGDIFFAGQNIAHMNDLALARWRNDHIGLVFQAYYLLPELDALENVCLPARMARKSVDSVIPRARDLLARVGLANRMDHRPSELSGGEQQRVAIARALINEPQLVLADEPTGNLDSHSGGEIIELLQTLWRESHTTLIIATHDAKVAALAPHVIEIVDGKAISNHAPSTPPCASPL